MQQIHTSLTDKRPVSIPGLILSFIAGCLAAAIFWYFLI
jgi:hypothetical protein